MYRSQLAQIWLQSFRDPEGQLAQWLEILVEYQFTVQHCPSSKHVNADALLRIPCKQCALQEKLEGIPVEAVIMATEILPQNNSPELHGHLDGRQRNCAHCNKQILVYTLLSSG